MRPQFVASRQKRQRILVISAVGIAHRYACLADATQSFLDQPLVTAMKWLVTPEKQGRRTLRIEWRTQSRR
jgi:hypothetical protein